MSDLADPEEGEALRRIKAKSEADTAAAERELRAFLERRPDSYEGQFLLGQICFRRSGFEDMVEAFAKAAALDAASAAAVSYKGLGYFYLGRLPEAIEAYERALAIREAPADLMRLGCCRHRLGQLTDAIRALERALKTLKSADRRHGTYIGFFLMRALREAGRLPDADRIAREILRFVEQRPNSGSSTLVVHINQLDFPGWDRFRKKEGLHEAIAQFRLDRGPAASPAYPRSFSMPGDAEALDRAAAEASGPKIWIVKPTFLFGGQGMKLTASLDEIPREPGHIVQEYLDRPFLVRDRKCHIRLYLLITSVAPPRVYLWRDGIVRIAPEPYREAPGWLERPAIHITNTALHRGHPDLMLSQDPDEEDVGNIWSLGALLRHIAAEALPAAEMWARFEDLAARFARVIEHSGLFRQQAEQPGREAYPPKLLGMDVLLDADLRPWLLEAQRTPGQTGSPLIEKINARLFRTITAMSVFPLLEALPAGVSAEAMHDDVAARQAHEAELEYGRRGNFVRLLPEEPAARDL